MTNETSFDELIVEFKKLADDGKVGAAVRLRADWEAENGWNVVDDIKFEEALETE
jgi:hypothetical protein